MSAAPSPSPLSSPPKPASSKPKAPDSPVFNFRADDLSHPGTTRFLTSIPSVHSLLSEAAATVNCYLYTTRAAPSITSITLIIRPMPGVAYTTGSSHAKEIHFSASYIAGIAESRVVAEITGVVLHEMVHVWQFNGHDSCPGGLVEGIADWVRFKEGLGPPHWKRGGEAWDDGYQNTAYFLEWVEQREGGKGFVSGLNWWLKEHKYKKAVWKEMCGCGVRKLWREYRKAYNMGPSDGDDGGDEESEDEDEGSVVMVGSKKSDAGPPGSPSISVSSFNAFAFGGESALVEILRNRLQNMAFDGRGDGKRFVKEFEGLIAKVQPGMASDDKRMLLTTSFKGVDVNSWYEETDLDDDLPYETLVEALVQKWTGVSRRRVRIIERDAKID